MPNVAFFGKSDVGLKRTRNEDTLQGHGMHRRVGDLCQWGGYVVGHIGDSRTFRLREGQLQQLTWDHSFVQDQITQGLITPKQAKQHHLRNVILRAVGVTESRHRTS